MRARGFTESRNVKQRCGRFAERVHAHFHHALPDGPVVAVARQVPDRVEHQLSNATSIGIVDVRLVHGEMQRGALLEDAVQERVQIARPSAPTSA